jgi:hypothetical protein
VLKLALPREVPAMHRTHYAGTAGTALKDETRAGGGAGSWGSADDHGYSLDCVPTTEAGQASHAEAALLRIEGEAYAAAFLDRLQAGTAQPDELASLLTFLGEDLRYGACKLLQKALQGVRHG